LIDDEMLATFAVVGPVDDVGSALKSRCTDVVDRVLPIFMTASQNCVSAAMKEFRQ